MNIKEYCFYCTITMQVDTKFGKSEIEFNKECYKKAKVMDSKELYEEVYDTIYNEYQDSTMLDVYRCNSLKENENKKTRRYLKWNGCTPKFTILKTNIHINKVIIYIDYAKESIEKCQKDLTIEEYNELLKDLHVNICPLK